MLSIISAILCNSLVILRLKFDSRNKIGTLRVEADDIFLTKVCLIKQMFNLILT